MTTDLTMYCPTLAFGMPGGTEWIILLVLGLLIFGRRLPEVGRSLGKGIVEFKRGIKGIDDEIEEESSRPQQRIASEDPTARIPSATVQPPAETTANVEAEKPAS